MAEISQTVWELAWVTQSGDRIPVGARFSAPVQADRPCGPPSSVYYWYPVPTPSSAEVKERVEMYLYSLSVR